LGAVAARHDRATRNVRFVDAPESRLSFGSFTVVTGAFSVIRGGRRAANWTVLEREETP
jgi:hypothetical protein